MPGNIKIPLTSKEKKVLKSFAHRRIEDYLDGDDKKGANRWKKIIEHLDSGYLTKEEIEEIIDDIYMVMSEVWCSDEEYDEAFNHYSIAKKLGKYIK